jgi:ATP/maltotriose-dependent transcriptional regulator MalT
VLAGYGWADLSDRLDLLATLYRASGDLDKALAVLEESEKLCNSHRIPFDGKDLLREYRKEKGNTRASGGRSLQ